MRAVGGIERRERRGNIRIEKRREITRLRKTKNLVGEYGQFIGNAVINWEPMKFS